MLAQSEWPSIGFGGVGVGSSSQSFEVTRCEDDDQLVYLTQPQHCGGVELIQLRFDSARRALVSERTLLLPKVGCLLDQHPLMPTALLGFSDHRVLVGYANRIAFADLDAADSNTLGSFARGSRFRAIDKFAWDGRGVVAAVDDTMAPKRMFMYDVASHRTPTLRERVELQERPNQRYEDAVFLSDSLLVLMDTYGHRGGKGHGLHFIHVGGNGSCKLGGVISESVGSGHGRSVTGGYSDWTRLAKTSAGELIVAANDRGILVVNAGAASTEEIAAGIKAIDTPFQAIDVVCRNGLVIALLQEERGVDDMRHHVVILDESRGFRTLSTVELGPFACDVAWGNLALV